MTLFLLGFAAAVALALAILFLVVAWDKRHFPDCEECQTPLPPRWPDKICPRCQEYAIYAGMRDKKTTVAEDVQAGGAK